MSSSSPYPILDNRPIDKWKVTELKEELKRRRLPVRGLKEELVRRLDESLRAEQEQSDNDNDDAVAAHQEAEKIAPVSGGYAPPHVAPVHAALSMETTPPHVAPVHPALSTETTPSHVAPVDAALSTETTPPPVVDVKPQEPQEVDVSEPNVEKSDLEMDVKAQQSKAVVETYDQVPEVIPVTGFEVKSDCISTDSVSNNELKDNKIADDVELEPNVNKPSTTTVSGKSHPMDVEEPLEQKKISVDTTKGNSIVDSEKLNLDRSSGDDESMEDEPETKHIESVMSHEVVNNNEKNHADVMDAEKGEASGNKRKLPTHNEEAVGNNEPAKRQRRWNSGSVKVPEAQATNSDAPTVTPKSTDLKREFTRTDYSVSEDGPKERVVPPSPKEPTNSLRIDHFLRPFTLKAVQELLGKTGNVTSFWMDNIKTHCYVSYASVEEAVATREAVYNIQWPPNGGRLLTAEFVEPEEVKAKLEAPPPQPQKPAQAPSRPTPTALPPPPPLAKAPPVVERVTALPPPPPLPLPVAAEEEEPPIVTLDDLFKKTKAIPRIYYLPLTEEQVAAKLAAQGQ